MDALEIRYTSVCSTQKENTDVSCRNAKSRTVDKAVVMGRTCGMRLLVDFENAFSGDSIAFDFKKNFHDVNYSKNEEPRDIRLDRRIVFERNDNQQMW